MLIYKLGFIKPSLFQTCAMAMIDLTMGKEGKKVKIYRTTLEATMREGLSVPTLAKIKTATGAIDPE